MFTRIIESEEYGQILLIKDYDVEDDMDTLRFVVKPSMLGICEACLKYSTEDRRDVVFESVTTAQAEVVVQDIFATNKAVEEDYKENE